MSTSTSIKSNFLKASCASRLQFLRFRGNLEYGEAAEHEVCRLFSLLAEDPDNFLEWGQGLEGAMTVMEMFRCGSRSAVVALSIGSGSETLRASVRGFGAQRKNRR